MVDKFVYSFDEGGRNDRWLLGGKGANLCEMTRMGLPVPPGFVITTEACRRFLEDNRFPPGLVDAVHEQVGRLEKATGRVFGGERHPLLVSVRSGAAVSMPGMMDTILNLGLNRTTVRALYRETSDPRFTFDAYRRFLDLFGTVALGVPEERFRERVEAAVGRHAVPEVTQLGAVQLEDLALEFKETIETWTGWSFPEDPYVQLELAIRAVFSSWLGRRAQDYRRRLRITADIANGTAVAVCTMAFGNLGSDSATGVGFTRNPATGEPGLYGAFLATAQGEDVVAGVRTPAPLDDLKKEMPGVYKDLLTLARTLEDHFREVQNFEFTIERGSLYCLQTRDAKMSAPAVVRTSVEMVREGLIDRAEALQRTDPAALEQLLVPQIRGASPEAVVARGMGKPCISGCQELDPDAGPGRVRIGGSTFDEGDVITIDGTTGQIYAGEIPTEAATLPPEFEELLSWADGLSSLEIRANADTPEDALRARAYGARGIGLWRTERMFNAPDRLPMVRDMIVADSDAARARALAALLPLQRSDFERILTAMSGFPVTVRLLDTPLHEFLPHAYELEHAINRLGLLQTVAADLGELPEAIRLVDPALHRRLSERIAQVHGDLVGLARAHSIESLIEGKRVELKRVLALAEVNPMLGHRGVRLGLTFPDVYRMQIRAIVEAAAGCIAEGVDARPEIVVPQVVTAAELRRVHGWVAEIQHEVEAARDVSVPLKFGSMVETVRACMRAPQLSEVAEFFSFGTNDLTQAVFSFSREDVEAKFLPLYNETGILRDNPFEVLDVEGVGRLIKMTVEAARERRPAAAFGICGEQAAHPGSIAFSQRIGLDYVSCSAVRVPAARVAAAQAALREGPATSRRRAA